LLNNYCIFSKLNSSGAGCPPPAAVLLPLSRDVLTYRVQHEYQSAVRAVCLWTNNIQVFVNFLTVNFVLCLGLTNICTNSYQYIISFCCCYMFRQLCAILRELVCIFWVTCKFGVWLIKFCAVCDCVYIMWWPGTYRSIDRSIYRYAPDRHILYTQPHTTQNCINQKPELACNSEDTDELPDDVTQLPKHVAAAKWNNKLIRIDKFVDYSDTIFR
jgi:hypothetical protein